MWANLVRFLGVGLLLTASSGCGDRSRGTRAESSDSAPELAPAAAREDPAKISPAAGPGELHPVHRDSGAPVGFDGWDSEAFSVVAGQQFARLMSAWNDPGSGTAEVIDPACVATPLRPAGLPVTWQNPWTKVTMGPKTPAGSLPVELDFARASVDLRALFAGCDDVHGKFKVIDVQIAPDKVSTRQFVSLVGHVADRTIESHATWYTEWTRSQEDPRITRVEREAYQETEVTRALFADCASGVLPEEPRLRAQLAHGNSHWRYRIEGHYAIHQFGYNGIAIADINGDGLDDAYVCQPGGLPNLLLLQQVDGTTRSAAPSYGVDYLDNTRSALCVDLDNDGDQDLVLAQEHWVLVLDNDGAGQFIERSRIKVDQVFSMVAADVDNDRWVDIYLCVYNGNQAQVNEIPVPYPIYDANNGGRNRLVHNRGGWEFVDGTEALGLNENNTRFSFAAQWIDFDRDGDLDLYVANDFGRNNLYRNDRGRFRDVAAELKVEDATTGMSVATGDYDRDGRWDIYVSNMFSSAGNRVTKQRRFLTESGQETIDKYRYMARGNTLFRQIDENHFEDTSDVAGVTLGRWAWGSEFVDLNNDGWQDLIVANGYMTGKSIDDL